MYHLRQYEAKKMRELQEQRKALQEGNLVVSEQNQNPNQSPNQNSNQNPNHNHHSSNMEPSSQMKTTKSPEITSETSQQPTPSVLRHPTIPRPLPLYQIINPISASAPPDQSMMSDSPDRRKYSKTSIFSKKTDNDGNQSPHSSERLTIPNSPSFNGKDEVSPRSILSPRHISRKVFPSHSEKSVSLPNTSRTEKPPVPVAVQKTPTVKANNFSKIHGFWAQATNRNSPKPSVVKSPPATLPRDSARL